MANPTETRRGPEPPDLAEKGGIKNGVPQRSDTRLFMQFMAFGGCPDATPVADTLARAKIAGVLYEDVNDPRGIGLLTLSEDPDYFVDRVASAVLAEASFASLAQKPEFTMLGRTYAIGYEPDLPEVLLHRPRAHWCSDPLEGGRCGIPASSMVAAQLSAEEQRVILAEHGTIGMSFGAGDYAHDIRLACHGLDKADNDFIVGLIGKDLFPLSAVVQAMRRTQQTALYLEHLGPFFVGRAMWQSAE